MTSIIQLLALAPAAIVALFMAGYLMYTNSDAGLVEAIGFYLFVKPTGAVIGFQCWLGWHLKFYDESEGRIHCVFCTRSWEPR